MNTGLRSPGGNAVAELSGYKTCSQENTGDQDQHDQQDQTDQQYQRDQQDQQDQKDQRNRQGQRFQQHTQATHVPLNYLAGETMPGEVLSAIEDLARLCPMLAGASCITAADLPGRTDGCLTVRTGEEEIEVKAPWPLLTQVFSRCDGTHSMEEILAGIGNEHRRIEFGAFLTFLLGQGVLIDASLYCLQASRMALHSSPVGLSADPAVTGMICRRFLANAAARTAPGTDRGHEVVGAPLLPLYKDRMSSLVFGGGQVAMVDLHRLLWSLAGIVRSAHPRLPGILPLRTIASAGGMHLLEIYVVLQDAVGEHEAGAYRVFYPEEGRILLRRVTEAPQSCGSDANTHDNESSSLFHTDLPEAAPDATSVSAALARTFSKPWEIAQATGSIFIAADAGLAALRYRNRSLQYLFMEAGAALQNGALCAARLGLGFATIGSFHESCAAHLCGLDKQLVLCSAMFGKRATSRRQRQAEQSAQFDFAWINASSPHLQLGFHMARARIKVPGQDRPFAWGRDNNPWLAMRRALAEAVEREGFREPRHIEIGSFETMKGAVDPRHLVRYRQSQYHDNFGYQRFDPLSLHAWASGIDLATGKSVRVLAEMVFSKASLLEAGFAVDRPYTQVTSSGCAASTSRADAQFRGLLELIERDAFMRHWLAQSAGAVVSAALLPVAIRTRLARLENAGCRICVQQLPSQWAHVALVAAQHEKQHFTTLGTAAATDYLAALESALAEMEARVYSWLHGYTVQIRSPRQVSTTEDHFALYGLKSFFRRADKVLFPKQARCLNALPPGLETCTAKKLASQFARNGLRSLAFDITPRQHLIEQGRTVLTVVRMFVPGLLPLSFGFGKEPLGMVARVAAGARFPHPFP